VFVNFRGTLDFFIDQLKANLAAPPPLAIDYTSRDDQDLSESDEDEDNDEYPEDTEDAEGAVSQG
jgi:hypothetical protein